MSENEQDRELAPIEPQELDLQLYDIQFSPNLDPVELKEELSAAGFVTEAIPTEQLVDHTFTCYRVKAFPSRFEGQDVALFCEVMVDGMEHPVGVVLGGQVVMEKVGQFLSVQRNRPFRATLRRKEGGRYGRYYDLE